LATFVLVVVVTCFNSFIS